MKKLREKVVALIIVLTMCVGTISGYAEIVNAAGASRPSNVPGNDEKTRYTVLLLDVEGGFSMLNEGVEIYKVETPINEVKQAAKKFVEQMMDVEGRNYVAIIAYGGESKLICDFTNDAEKLNTEIDNIGIINGRADINEALLKANDIFQNNDDINSSYVKNIVHFTQGVNSAGEEYSDEGRYSLDDCHWYNTSTKIYQYQYANVSYRTFESIKEKYNIYSIGLFQQFNEVPEKGKSLLNFAKRLAEDIQNAGYIEVDDVDNLIFAFDKVAEDITIEPVTFSFASTYAHTDVQAACYYSDSYFSEPSTVYNDHLATMSLCLELSSWSSEKNYTIWTDNEMAAFPKFINARSLLLQLEFEDFKVNDFWAEEPSADSIGAIAANKKLSDGSTLIALAIRGGGYGEEWASNFTIGLEGDHEGFAEAKDNIIEFLYEYLSANQITGNVKLWIVGYSRAGAVANLVAAELSYPTKISSGYNWNREDVYAYTFEAPQGAFENMKNKKNYDNIHNTINVNDLVPNVAPSAWDFVRYGKDIYLPNSVNVGDGYSEAYTVAIDEMEKYLSQFKKGAEEKRFDVQEDVFISTLKIDTSSIKPFGDPFISTEWISVSRYTALIDTVNCLANDIIGSRDNYYYRYQALIREIISISYNENILELFGDDDVKLEFISKIKEKLTYDRIIQILSPLVTVNWIDRARAEEMVIDNIKKLIQEVLDETGSGYSIIAITEIKDTLAEIIHNLFMVMLDAIETKDYDEINSIAAVILLGCEGVLFQPHYPEFTLAWMMYKDSYYGENDSIKVGRSYRVIHINCPVDVNVYSEDSGKLVASIVDDESQEIEGSYIVSYVNDNGEKIVILPADTNYKVNIEATGNGTFNYTIDEYSYDAQGNTRTINYYDIDIEEGDIFTARLPRMCDEELYGENLTGSTTVYSLLTSDGIEITSDNEVCGEAALIEYDVEITLGSEYGYVLGGGSYSVGSFAQIEAYPYVGGEFIGWYNGDELVSTDEMYRFAVKESTELIAMFSEVEMYNLDFATNEGGTVTNISLTVPTGVNVQLEANPTEGYEFDYWSTNGKGIFADSTSSSTIYTMSGENTTIEAHWKKIGGIDEVVIEPDIFEENIEPKNSVEEHISENEDTEMVDLNTGYNNSSILIIIYLLTVTSIIVCSKKRTIG